MTGENSSVAKTGKTAFWSGLGRVLRNALRPRRALPGESYGAPGAGSSLRISVIVSFLLLGAWWLAAALELVPPLFLPGPETVLLRIYAISLEDFAGGTLIQHTVQSLYRIFTAFFLACLTAIPIGLMMGVNRFVRGVFDPPVEFYRPIPPLAYLPLTVIWLGIGEEQKVTLIYLAMFAPMALSARAGVRSVAIEQIHAAYSLGASRMQIIIRVVFRAALPEILTGMRIGIGFGWTTLVAAEIVAAELGLGHMTLIASEFLVTDAVIAGILIIGLVAWLFDLLMRYLERRLVPWKGRA